MKTNFILFHKGQLPDHIKICVEQIFKTQTDFKIYLLTDSNVICEGIEVVNINEYPCPWIDDLSYFKHHNDPLFRTSFERFFYINAFILQNNINNIVHFDNDVLIFKDVNDISNILNDNITDIGLTPHKKNELVCGFMFIKNKDSLNQLCEELFHIAQVGEEALEKQFKTMPHEMRLLGYIDWKLRDRNYITRLPVSPYSPGNNMFEKFEGVFDPSTYGQYFGNDYRVHENDVNRIADRFIGRKVFPKIKARNPFLATKCPDYKRIPIFNLHIHNKKLHEYNIR